MMNQADAEGSIDKPQQLPSSGPVADQKWRAEWTQTPDLLLRSRKQHPHDVRIGPWTRLILGNTSTGVHGYP